MWLAQALITSQTAACSTESAKQSVCAQISDIIEIYADYTFIIVKK